jgi:hypothetical protein
MSKHAITCVGWKPLVRNTLRGFASIRISEINLTIHDVAIHEKGESRWAALPARPQLKDGMAITKDGKIQYATLLEFSDHGTRNAFSQAVIRAVLDFAPSAFDREEAACAP